MLASQQEHVQTIPSAFIAGNPTTRHVIDLSAGCISYAIDGTRVDTKLQRLSNVSAVPLVPGAGTRARGADTAANVVRIGPSKIWTVSDQSHDACRARWIHYAAEAAA